MGDIVAIDKESRLTAREIRANVNLIQEVMQAVMKPDIHYGKIPGTPKPTLYKAGSEKILATFRIAVDPEVQDLSNSDERRYRVVCRGILPSGEIVGSGVGECSTDEEKYKWRSAVCDEEYNDTPEDRRRTVWKKGQGGKPYCQKQVRTNPADLANTVLKMAKKRAQIDLTLTATAASDVFEQDIEDLPDEYREQMRDRQPPQGKPSVQQPQSRSQRQQQQQPPPQGGEDTAKVAATLHDELSEYCGGDPDSMEMVLRELSGFEDRNKEWQYMTVPSLHTYSFKWLTATLRRLREKTGRTEE